MELSADLSGFRLPALVLLSVFFSHTCVGQNECDSISWSASRLLTWADFRGVPDTSSSTAALSHISFKYKLESEGKKVRLITVAYFRPCTSWVDSSLKSSPSLVHEQTHFNIDEWIRRAFVEDVINHPLNEKKLVRNIQHLYFIAMLSRYLMHNSYDLETNYHRNELQQHLWNDRLLELLNSKRNYSSTVYEWNLHD